MKILLFMLFMLSAATFFSGFVSINDPESCNTYDNCRIEWMSFADMPGETHPEYCFVAFESGEITHRCIYRYTDECMSSADMCLTGANGCPTDKCINVVAVMLIIISFIPLISIVIIAVDSSRIL